MTMPNQKTNPQQQQHRAVTAHPIRKPAVITSKFNSESAHNLSTTHNKPKVITPRTILARPQKLLIERCRTAGTTRSQNSHLNSISPVPDLISDSTSSFKSVRRDKANISLINKARDSKIHLLQHFKRKDLHNNLENACSRRCLFNV